MKGKEALCNHMCIEIESNRGIASYEPRCTQLTHDFQSNDHTLKIKYIDQGWIKSDATLAYTTHWNRNRGDYPYEMAKPHWLWIVSW